MNSIPVFGVVLCLIISISAAPHTSKESGSGRAVTYLGTYEGRLFYQAETTVATHATSVTRCASQGMTLAQVRSSEELAYLRTVLSSSYSYWVAGQSIDFFRWADGTAVVGVPVVADSPVCLYIPKSTLSKTELYDNVCTNNSYTLCQSV